MEIIVCIKQVPEVIDAELEIDRDGTDIDREDLEFDINEWDNYAVEEAVRIKERHGGKVTVVTLGDEESEDVLRQALAMGADEAIRIDWDGFEGSDAAGIARGLYRALKGVPFDLILTGVQASDDGWGQVGLTLAEYFGLPYASLVVGIEVEEGTVIATRELEAGIQEKVLLPLPALMTIQSGINIPRYVSITGIRSVRNVEIREVDAGDLGLGEEEIGAGASALESIALSLPEAGDGAEILKGSLEEVCEKVAWIIREKGGTA
ncbi:MAG: electron transfer flavoprotein subunit beta [Deltaproteobacteria bacterium]|nr:electron transfer flavoprotein subunit beta [Deltaproteobacteria bacterium]MBW2015241.1 electron transfer flavoprotein subunit beta [Deltaproteobacteria bacterium]MBW2128518.1 electron transfer flavoprotein subunit beta [Deltaproteobacteria bacterium]MBW2302358.1 electron transfer flavoprotein subunit beta [Deltaproteobacteria bacterium]